MKANRKQHKAGASPVAGTVGFVAIGLLSVLLGGRQLFGFLMRLDQVARLTPGDVLRLLVLPHLLMLTGAGLILTGILKATKHAIERSRH